MSDPTIGLGGGGGGRGGGGANCTRNRRILAVSYLGVNGVKQ